MCDFTPAVQLHLPFNTQAPSRARQFVNDASCPIHPNSNHDDSELVVTELVTNGLRHGSEPITVTIECRGPDGLHIAVADADPGEPHVHHPGPNAEGGRGLLLVDYISKAWGVQASPDGKIVWVLI